MRWGISDWSIGQLVTGQLVTDRARYLVLGLLGLNQVFHSEVFVSEQIRLSPRWLWFAGVFSLLFLLITSCRGQELSVTSSISPEPLVGQTVNYHIKMSSVIALPNATLTITLPSGITLIEGDLSWHGDLAEDQEVTKDLAIRVTSAGEWVVTAYAVSDMGKGDVSRQRVTATQSLYITSSANSAEVVDALQKTPTPCGPDVSCGRRPIPITSSSITTQP
jgi:hypothetical protein